MNKNTTRIAIGIVAFLVIVTGGLYLYVATQEISEANDIFVQQETDESIQGGLIEAVLFATVGGAYIPVGIWTLSSRNSSKSPYYLAIIGSVALIVLYVMSRTVDMPLVGQQTDIGFIDLSSKALQGGIIASSLFVISTIRKQKQIPLTK